MPDAEGAPVVPDQPTEEATNDAPAVPDQPSKEDALDSFDISQVPEDADREWLGNRHKEMTGSLTRKSQELAESRRQVSDIVQAIQDPNHADHSTVMEELGLGDDRTTEDAYGEEYSDSDTRITQLENQLHDRDERDQEARLEVAEAKWMGNARKDLEAAGSKLTEEEWAMVSGYAVSNRFDDGEPDVDGGLERLTQAWDAKQKAYETSKKAPRKPGSGMPAHKDNDTSTREGRIAIGEQIARAMEQDN